MEVSQSNRSSNFSKKEVDILLDSLEACPQLITGEIGGKIPTKHHQRLAWEAVAQKVSEEGVERTGDQVKSKWFDLKYRTRLKVKKIKHIKGIDQIPLSSFTNLEIRVLSILGLILTSTEDLQSVKPNFVDAREALMVKTSEGSSYESPDHGSLRTIIQEMESDNEYSEEEEAKSDTKDTVLTKPSNNTKETTLTKPSKNTQVKEIILPKTSSSEIILSKTSSSEIILPNTLSKKASLNYSPSTSAERVSLYRLRKRKWEDDEITEERIVATQERMATDIYKIRCSVNEMKSTMNTYMKKIDQKFDKMLNLLAVALNVEPQDLKT